jgi:glycerol-3-phosphate dehydrogenase subunit B
MPQARNPYDVVVVGMGLAGLTAGLAAADRGARTLVVGKGYGTTHFRPGTIDVLGFVSGSPVSSPRTAVAELCAEQPEHPYALLRERIEPGMRMIVSALAESGLELSGGLDANGLVATAAGTLRPACLAQPSLLAEWAGARVLAVGLGRYRDFDPELVAAVLPAAGAARDLGISARAVRVEVPQLRRRHLDGLTLSRLFEQRSFRSQLAKEIRGHLDDASVVAFPAVLGMEGAAEVHRAMVDELGRPVVELPTLPPSVPGIRMQRALETALRRRGADVSVGPGARVRRQGRRAIALELDAAAHPLRIPLGSIVLASGGLAGGGLQVDETGRIVEPIAGLPVAGPAADPGDWFRDAFLGPAGHVADTAGLRVDARMRPLDGAGEVVCENLFAAGGLLAGARRPVERSSDGIACASGYAAGLEASDYA